MNDNKQTDQEALDKYVEKHGWEYRNFDQCLLDEKRRGILLVPDIEKSGAEEVYWQVWHGFKILSISEKELRPFAGIWVEGRLRDELKDRYINLYVVPTRDGDKWICFFSTEDERYSATVSGDPHYKDWVCNREETDDCDSPIQAMLTALNSLKEKEDAD